MSEKEKSMEKQINRHQCFACCLKHLSSALVIAGEIKTGYDSDDYHLYLLGNLAEAQEQVAVRSPMLANALRDLRLRMFGTGGRAKFGAPELDRLRQLARVAQQAVEPAAGPRRPPRQGASSCCGRKKPEKEAKKAT